MKILNKVLLILLLLVTSFLAAQSQPKPAISHSCNVQNGFYFQRDVQDDIGHVVNMTISTNQLNADFTVMEPIFENPVSVTVLKENKEVLNLLNKGIMAAKLRGIDQELQTKWFSK